MPLITVNGLALNYTLEGPSGAPVVAFSNSLGTTMAMWDALVPALRGRYRCLRYDTRGHGRSMTRDAVATIADLAADLAGLLDALGIAQVHVVGLSLGGMTAQALAAASPDRVASLTLMATSAFMPSEQSWNERAAIVRAEGMAPLVEATMGRWFTADFAASAPERIARVREAFLVNDPAGYAVACAAIGQMDLRPDLAAITAPTLVIAGRDDSATPVAMAQEICDRIAQAELVILPRAAHLLAVERPEATAAYLLAFLDRQPRTAQTGAVPFETGLENRRAVLGLDHVGRSLAGAGAFGLPWQDFITRIAWGEVWGDPRLPWKTRSFVTLALMAALGREEEFKLHIRPARTNGVGILELQALLVQVAVYAGVPAANAAFRWTHDLLGADLAAFEASSGRSGSGSGL